jgi:hypothetical protein
VAPDVPEPDDADIPEDEAGAGGFAGAAGSGDEELASFKL